MPTIGSINFTNTGSANKAAETLKNANEVIRQATPEELQNYKVTRFDRYEGVSADDDAISLNDNSHPVVKGIFSENTSFEVGEKVLRAQEKYDGVALEGFSAKHIVSVFFQAESEDRYNCSVNYEHAADTDWGWSGQDTIGPEVCNGKFTEDNVALIASQVGKYIDSLYGQGKYTDDEYAQLNEEIKKCSKHWIDMITVAKIGKRLREEDAKLYGSRFYVKIPKKTREERLLEELSMRKKIEAENPFDINAFFDKVDQMRFNVTGIEENSEDK